MLRDLTSQQLTDTQNRQQAYFSTLDLKYAYSQLQLPKVAAKYCNFFNICGQFTGTYRFKTEFYGLTNKQLNSKKTMDYTLGGLQNTYCFLDVIKIATTGSKSHHLSSVINVLKSWMKITWESTSKIVSSLKQIEWLRYDFTQTGTSPIKNKTAAILAIPPPSTLKILRSILGSVHYIINFLPNLAQICHPLSPLLKDSTKILWTAIHTKYLISWKTNLLQVLKIALIIPNWTFE